jgi:hypothetical protein
VLDSSAEDDPVGVAARTPVETGRLSKALQWLALEAKTRCYLPALPPKSRAVEAAAVAECCVAGDSV